MKKYVCSICGYVYDEEKGMPEAGIPAGTKWEDLPGNWTCPLCGAAKADFKEQGVTAPAKSVTRVSHEESLHEFSFGELSALCSHLARGCEKQYLQRESELFRELSSYYLQKSAALKEKSKEDLEAMVHDDLSTNYPSANQASDEAGDRGAKRALVWSEKATHILNGLLERYAKEGNGFIENTHVYVCDICGFIYVGETPPEICPICKVPSMKILPVERGQ